MTANLAPCPFCGGPAEMDTQQGFARWNSQGVGTAIAIYCTECSAQQSLCRDDVPDLEPETVIEMWNRRPVAPGDKELHDPSAVLNEVKP